MKTHFMICAFALFVSVGCDKKDADTPKPESVTAAAAANPVSAPAPVPAAVTLTDQDLPVARDYEAEAKSGITPANYKAEVVALEKEINAKE